MASPPGQAPAGHLDQDSVRKAKGRADHIRMARQCSAVSAEIPIVRVHRVQKTPLCSFMQVEAVPPQSVFPTVVTLQGTESLFLPCLLGGC